MICLLTLWKGVCIPVARLTSACVLPQKHHQTTTNGSLLKLATLLRWVCMLCNARKKAICLLVYGVSFISSPFQFFCLLSFVFYCAHSLLRILLISLFLSCLHCAYPFSFVYFIWCLLLGLFILSLFCPLPVILSLLFCCLCL